MMVSMVMMVMPVVSMIFLFCDMVENQAVTSSAVGIAISAASVLAAKIPPRSRMKGSRQ